MQTRKTADETDYAVGASPTLQVIAYGPPVDKKGSPSGAPYVLDDKKRTWSTLRNYWYTNGEWHHELLFYTWGVWEERLGISPNYRYWWHSTHRLYYAPIGEKKYRPLTEDGESCNCVFSPDSRYLAGVSVGTSERNVSVFEMPSGRRRTFHSPRALFLGWYPDGRRLWFGDRERWFQLDVERWQVREITSREAQALHRKWEFLNPRLRTWRMWADYRRADNPLGHQGWHYAYSRNGEVRLAAHPIWWEPNYDRPVPVEWRPQTVWVEWRNGRRVQLFENRQKGVALLCNDVSDDGRWAIVEVCQHGGEGWMQILKQAWWLFDVRKKQRVWQFVVPERTLESGIVARALDTITGLHFGIGSVLR